MAGRTLGRDRLTLRILEVSYSYVRKPIINLLKFYSQLSIRIPASDKDNRGVGNAVDRYINVVNPLVSDSPCPIVTLKVSLKFGTLEIKLDQ